MPKHPKFVFVAPHGVNLGTPAPRRAVEPMLAVDAPPITAEDVRRAKAYARTHPSGLPWYLFLPHAPHGFVMETGPMDDPYGISTGQATEGDTDA